MTIGRDLIQDSYAAVVELVKNAYDADSEQVTIKFEAVAECGIFKVTISDTGHGMSREVVIDKWMVPSTRDKLDRKKSPGGRNLQGRKGVGRYAASILGDNLLLETIRDESKTTVYIEWSTFETSDYLDEVEILIETKSTAEAAGTNLYITGDNNQIVEWSTDEFRKLKIELKKLIPPKYNKKIAVSNESFDIRLIIEGFGKSDTNEIIEPFPIFDLYDYRISGFINSNGQGILNYSTQKLKNTSNETIVINLGYPTECGNLNFDIRVYDREPDAIQQLIDRGLKDEEGNFVGRLGNPPIFSCAQK